MECNRFMEDVIGLHELDTDLYEARCGWTNWSGRGAFGGQIITQALLAASKTVKPRLNLHSIHCYFLRAVDVTRSVIYQVIRTRDGKSFCARAVSALQQGKHVFTLQASFHDEDSEPSSILDYQPKMPVVPKPRELRHIKEYLAESPNGPLLMSIPGLITLPLDFRPVDPSHYLERSPRMYPSQRYWYRFHDNMGDDQNTNRAVAAFITDWSIVRASISSIPQFKPGLIVSLDHTIYFHRPVKATEWLLHETWSDQMFTGRAMCRGRLWNEDGQLVASVMQEGLIRNKL